METNPAKIRSLIGKPCQIYRLGQNIRYDGIVMERIVGEKHFYCKMATFVFDAPGCPPIPVEELISRGYEIEAIQSQPVLDRV
jgi:hypothetical protein